MPSVWIHKKTGDRYQVINGMKTKRFENDGYEHDERTFIEKGCVPAVIYFSLKDAKFWVRPYEEFMDGRFEETVE
jgi:hypothetical protein